MSVSGQSYTHGSMSDLRGVMSISEAETNNQIKNKNIDQDLIDGLTEEAVRAKKIREYDDGDDDDN
jgi:hypothetical protein